MAEKDVRVQLRREVVQSAPIVATLMFGLNHGLFSMLASFYAGAVLAYFVFVFLADRCKNLTHLLEHPMAYEVILQVFGFSGSIAVVVEMAMEPTAVVPIIVRSLSLMSISYIFEYRNIRRLCCALEISMGIAWVAYCVAQGEQLFIHELLVHTGEHWNDEDTWKARGTILVLFITCTCTHLRYFCLRRKLASGADVIPAQNLTRIVPDAPHSTPSQAVSNAASPNSGDVSTAGRATGPSESIPAGQTTAQDETTHAGVENCMQPPQPLSSDMSRGILPSKAIVDQEKRNDQDPTPSRGGTASSAGELLSTASQGETTDVENTAKALQHLCPTTTWQVTPCRKD